MGKGLLKIRGIRKNNYKGTVNRLKFGADNSTDCTIIPQTVKLLKFRRGCISNSSSGTILLEGKHFLQVFEIM